MEGTLATARPAVAQLPVGLPVVSLGGMPAAQLAAPRARRARRFASAPLLLHGRRSDGSDQGRTRPTQFASSWLAVFRAPFPTRQLPLLCDKASLVAMVALMRLLTEPGRLPAIQMLTTAILMLTVATLLH